MTEQGAPSGLLAAPTTDARTRQPPQGRWKQGEAEAAPGPRSRLSASEIGRVPGPHGAGPLLRPQIGGNSRPGTSSFCFCGQGAESSAGLRGLRGEAVPRCGACQDGGRRGAGGACSFCHSQPRPSSRERLFEQHEEPLPFGHQVPLVSAAAVLTHGAGSGIWETSRSPL